MSAWHFKLIGWPWWLVLPLAGLAVWGMARALALELGTQPFRVRRGLLFLRCGAVGLIVLLLLEPTLSKNSRVRELPVVGVLVDHSGSMDIRDQAATATFQLNDATALGLVTASGRPQRTNATAQAEADAEFVRQAGPDSALARGLGQWRRMTRFERAARLATATLLPALSNHARVKVLGFDQEAGPLDLTQPAKASAGGPTDLEAPLSALARQWAQEYVGGLVVVSDGRQTAGRDPVPVARAWRARGAVVSTLQGGDIAEPPDAVVAELQGNTEVFLEEAINLDAKYRITGDNQADWDLLLIQDGQEVARRGVRGNGDWQYAHFEVPAKAAGVSLFQARLERRTQVPYPPAPLQPTGTLYRELWLNVRGNRVEDLTRAGVLGRKPDKVETLTGLASPENVGEHYGSRIRGYLYPPVSGAYLFWITSDDASELWLSRSANPGERTRIASVSSFTPRSNWEADPRQRSGPVVLTVNQPCYFEVLHKQASGSDYVAVGWQLPNGSQERPVFGNRLAPYVETPRTPAAIVAAGGGRVGFEEATLANNQAELSVAVNQDPIRVYLADATPRWESRYLATMFERDRRVRLERHYQSILSGLANAALLPKNQQEWDQYDLVVLGDLDTSQLTPQQQQFAASFVAKRGGFLVCVAGPRGMPRNFSLGALASVLPIKVAAQTQRDTAPVTLSLTDAGRYNPITLVLKDPALNQRLWPALPPLQWIASSVAAKAAATVLLEAQNPVRTPVVALQRYGAGRVLWMGTGESWRWRDRLGDRVHHTFWLQAMRWGLGARLRGQDPRLQVSLDRTLLAPGDAAEVRARAALKDGTPLAASLLLRLEQIDSRGAVLPGSIRALEMKPLSDSPELGQVTLPDLAEGHWRLTVTNTHPRLAGLTESRDLLVRSAQGRETVELAADAATLARLAEAGGGQFGDFSHAAKMVADLAAKFQPRVRDQTQTYRLWDNYVVLVVAIGLLSLEWVWRKRLGLP